MRQELKAINWDQKLTGKSTNEMWTTIASIIKNGMESHVPHLNITSNPTRTKKAPWMTDRVRQQLKRKKTAFEAYKKTKDGTEYLTYAKEKNRSRYETRRAVKEFEKEIAKLAKKDPKKFYRFVNSKLMTRARIPDIELPSGVLTEKDTDKAEAFNEFFSGIFTKEDINNIPTVQHPVLKSFSTDAYTELFESEVTRMLDVCAPLRTKTRRQCNIM